MKLSRTLALLVVCTFLVALVGNADGKSQRFPSASDPTVDYHNVKDGPFATVGGDLGSLYGEYTTYREQVRRGAAPARFAASNAALPVVDDTVVIDAIATTDPQVLRDDLHRLGMRDAAVAGNLVSGRLPIAALDQAAQLTSLRAARPAYAYRNVGLVTSQGDVAMHANVARAAFGVDGRGLTIGTMSDSYDCLEATNRSPATNAAEDVRNGDLPAGIVVLRDLTSGGCADEGRAMMQLITDVAPGAQQQYRTAFQGEADFAQGIRELAAAGSDIIVDDIGYFAEPMFQDGVIAQAIDDVVSNGVVYFSAAGNSGRDSYESTFRDGGTTSFPQWVQGIAFVAHDFDPGPGVDTFQRFTLPPGGGFGLVLQWDQPFASVNANAGSANDVDVLLFESSNHLVPIRAAVDANIGGDPVEIFSYVNSTGQQQQVDLFIGKAEDGSATPNPGYIKYILDNFNGSIDEYATNSGTLYGHPNARGAIAVGAAFYKDTPAFGTSPVVSERFSAAGPMPIFFDAAGRRLPATDVRAKPEIVAPNGTNTTFFGVDIGGDSDKFPNFSGTSAAAPHAAAAAALLLQAEPSLTPQQIRTLFEESALDMGRAGFDDDTGYGFVDANVLLSTARSVDLQLATANEAYSLLGGTIDYTLTVSASGLSAATGVVLTNTLPTSTAFVSAQTSTGVVCNEQNGVVTCPLGTIGSSTAVTVVITARTTATGIITNTAIATTTSIDTDMANNRRVATTTVVLPADAADLAITSVNSTQVATTNQTLNYTFTVENLGQAVATNVIITVQLPPTATYLGASGADWACQRSESVVRCTRDALASGMTTAVTLRIQTPPFGTRFAFQAQVSTSTPDPRTNNSRVDLITDVIGHLFMPLLRR